VGSYHLIRDDRNCDAVCIAEWYQPPGESGGTTTGLQQSLRTTAGSFTYLFLAALKISV